MFSIRKLSILVLLITTILLVVACQPASAIPAATLEPLDQKIQSTIDVVYKEAGIRKIWEEVPGDGIMITTAKFPTRFTYLVTAEYGSIFLTHLITHVKGNGLTPKEAPLYTPYLLLYEEGFSGLMLLQKKGDKFYIERSLTTMPLSLLEKVIPRLEELEKLLQQQG